MREGGLPAVLSADPLLAGGHMGTDGWQRPSLSAVVVGALVLSVNFLPVPNEQALALGLLAVALAATIAFLPRERWAKNPLYDLRGAEDTR